jgi:hypothetical protein
VVVDVDGDGDGDDLSDPLPAASATLRAPRRQPVAVDRSMPHGPFCKLSMPAYRLLLGVVAPIVAVAVAVDDHVNDHVNDHDHESGSPI